MNLLRLWQRYFGNNRISSYINFFVLIALVGIILFQIYRYFTRWNQTYINSPIEIEEGFDDTPTVMPTTTNIDEGTLTKVLVLIEERLNKKDTVLEKVKAIQKTLEAGGSLSEDQLNTLMALYNDYIMLKNNVEKLQSQEKTNESSKENKLIAIIKMLEKTQGLLKEDQELYNNTMSLLGEKGYQVSFDENGNFLGVQKEKPSTSSSTGIDLEKPGEAEKLLYGQLVKKIQKLQSINKENISYYKKLNTEQQEILLDIINKRNAEIDRLKKMLIQLEAKLSKMIIVAEEEEQPKMSIRSPTEEQTSIYIPPAEDELKIVVPPEEMDKILDKIAEVDPTPEENLYKKITPPQSESIPRKKVPKCYSNSCNVCPEDCFANNKNYSANKGGKFPGTVSPMIPSSFGSPAPFNKTDPNYMIFPYQ